jgi:flagellar biosynthesis protein FlhG
LTLIQVEAIMQNTLEKLPVPIQKKENVLAIASGKGGVGKTWFSITLSHVLSQMNRKCLLFDGDLGLANVDIQLGLMPDRDLSSVVAGHITLKQACHYYQDGNFDILAGRSGVGNFASLSPMKITNLRNELYQLSNQYHHVVIDLGAGVERTMRLLSAYAGRYIVVTNAEPTALTDAYAFIKLTLYEDPRADIHILVNIAESYQDGEKTYNTLARACREFLKYNPKLCGIVRRDRRVTECIRNQTPVLNKYPQTYAVADVRNIAKKLLSS